MTNREKVIRISIDNKLSHMGSNLSALPIIEEIYAKKKPEEKFILSSGHAHLAHLAVMEEHGEIQSAEEELREHGIHCEVAAGCDVSTGSLGQGLPISVGIALADRSKNVYVLVSDGEMAEGSCWEALRIAKDNDLTNLKVYLNANGWSAYDWVDTQYLINRIKAFGFPVEIRRTNSDIGVWAQGLSAHYKVADKEIWK